MKKIKINTKCKHHTHSTHTYTMTHTLYHSPQKVNLQIKICVNENKKNIQLFSCELFLNLTKIVCDGSQEKCIQNLNIYKRIWSFKYDI